MPTGSKRPKADIDFWLDIGLELRLAADRFQSAADAALAPFGLTQTEFFVLRSTDALCSACEDAVSQSDVVTDTGIPKMKTSRAMRALERRGLVSRGPSAFGMACRVLMTARGRAVVRECRGELGVSGERLFLTAARVAEQIANLASSRSG